MMMTGELTQDTPGTTEASDTLVCRALRQYRNDMLLAELRVGWHAKARARTRAERALWRAVKHEQRRGALVFVQIKGTLIIFNNDAKRVARLLRLPSDVRQLRLRRESCDTLLDKLQLAGITVEIVKVDSR